VKYKYFGKTGMKVSELCLGSMTFGREASEKDSYKMMDIFADKSGNFIDTANIYSKGLSEEIVGKWLKNKNRNDFIIATKVRFPMSENPNDAGLSRINIVKAVEDSLRRLDTDYIDLYQVHAWDYNTPLEETLKTLDHLVKSGKVRYIGLSNHSGWQVQKALDMSEYKNLESYVSIQAKYNLMVRSFEWELMPICKNEGLALMVWGPLFGGWLSGRYKREMEEPPKGSRVEKAEKYNWFESWNNYNNEHTWSIIDKLFEISEKTGKSVAQVSLNWLLQKGDFIIPILGASKIKHLEDNLGCVGWSLTDKQVKELDEVSKVKLPYPYDFLEGTK
jgi:aryl-alcohol dehydrogenase-like predicted oxidoreductase